MKRLFKQFMLGMGLFFAALSLSFAQDPNTMKNDKNKLSADGEIIAFIIALNEHEIAAADVALGKNVQGRVNNFAKMMKDHHSKNLADTKQLSTTLNITPEETKAVSAFKKNGDKKLQALSALSDHPFEVAYIVAMVKGHSDAENKVNTFIKQAQNPELKKHLIATKETIQMHLKEAKAIQSDLKTKK